MELVLFGSYRFMRTKKEVQKVQLHKILLITRYRFTVLQRLH